MFPFQLTPISNAHPTACETPFVKIFVTSFFPASSVLELTRFVIWTSFLDLSLNALMPSVGILQVSVLSAKKVLNFYKTSFERLRLDHATGSLMNPLGWIEGITSEYNQTHLLILPPFNFL